VNTIWTGSDDGFVHVTKNGGVTWTNVTPNEMPEFGRVSQIDASAFDVASAYVPCGVRSWTTRNRTSFRTHDYGKT